MLTQNRIKLQLTAFYIYQINWVNELLEWHCHDDSNIKIAVASTILNASSYCQFKSVVSNGLCRWHMTDKVGQL